MKRAIVLAPDMSGAPLMELRKWLGISSNTEEALLLSLLRTSVEMCEAFTGLVPLETTLEFIIPPVAGWHRLAASPVNAIQTVAILSANGSRTPVQVGQYETEISSDGTGSIRLTGDQPGRAVAIRCSAGLAANWYALAEPLKHGIVRLAAHHFRDRDNAGTATPPASVAALWRPWRIARLA